MIETQQATLNYEEFCELLRTKTTRKKLRISDANEDYDVRLFQQYEEMKQYLRQFKLTSQEYCKLIRIVTNYLGV